MSKVHAVLIEERLAAEIRKRQDSELAYISSLTEAIFKRMQTADVSKYKSTTLGFSLEWDVYHDATLFKYDMPAKILERLKTVYNMEALTWLVVETIPITTTCDCCDAVCCCMLWTCGIYTCVEDHYVNTHLHVKYELSKPRASVVAIEPAGAAKEDPRA